MLRKTLLTLSASAMLGTAVIAPNAALAFGPPLPGLGGPPHLGGGPPHLPGLAGHAGLSRLGGPGFHGGGHGLQGNFHGSQGRSAAYGYGHSARYGYGHGEWRHGRGSYDVSVEGSDGSGGDGYASGDAGCTYTYSERRHRRVVVCDAN